MLDQKSWPSGDETPYAIKKVWRAQFYRELAEKSARRARASALRRAAFVGAILGVAASALLYLF